MIERNETCFLVKTENEYNAISLSDIEEVKKTAWEKTTAEQASSKIPKLRENEDCAKIFQKIMAKGYPLLPVFKENELIGVIRPESLQKLFELKKAQKSR